MWGMKSYIARHRVAADRASRGRPAASTASADGQREAEGIRRPGSRGRRRGRAVRRGSRPRPPSGTAARSAARASDVSCRRQRPRGASLGVRRAAGAPSAARVPSGRACGGRVGRGSGMPRIGCRAPAASRRRAAAAPASPARARGRRGSGARACRVRPSRPRLTCSSGIRFRRRWPSRCRTNGIARPSARSDVWRVGCVADDRDPHRGMASSRLDIHLGHRHEPDPRVGDLARDDRR